MTAPALPRVRPIEPADLDRLLAINEANVPEVGSVDVGRFGFILSESPIALVVQVADALAGFCLVMGAGSSYDSVNYQWFRERYDDFMYLDRVAFDPSFQGQGLGTLLYAEVERLMYAFDGVERLTLEVNVDPPNERSLAFHTRRGFSEVGQQDTPYGIRVSMQQRILLRT
jgi:uncharacterized protein